MKSARLHTKGFTLIASLLLLLLLSGLAIGLLMMVNTEGRVGGTDMQNDVAYHSAEGGIEKMSSDLAATFQNTQAPRTIDICNVSNNPPAMAGVTWMTYSVAPASGCTQDPPLHNWGQIVSGPDQGLWAQIIPVNMMATAAQMGGQEVSMMRSAQVALIPVFQFGVFCEGDCAFFQQPHSRFCRTRTHQRRSVPGRGEWLHDYVSPKTGGIRERCPAKYSERVVGQYRQ